MRRWLRRNGFNTIRLGIIYKGLEPNPPSASGRTDYTTPTCAASRTECGARQAADLHAARLPPGPLQRALPGRGLARLAGPRRRPAAPSRRSAFPATTSSTRASTGPSTTSGPTPRPRGRGLQESYAAAWQHVAADFATNPYIFGYDLLNEPWPGSAFSTDGCASTSGCATFDTTTLAPVLRQGLRARFAPSTPRRSSSTSPSSPSTSAPRRNCPTTATPRAACRSTCTACRARSAGPAPGRAASHSRISRSATRTSTRR